MLLITIGVLFLGSELHLWGGIYLSRIWPVALIALGLGFLAFPGEGGRGGGLWLLLVGSIFLLHTSRILSIRDSWPLFIVATGISILAGGLKSAPQKKV
jgi:hypothetical protein